MQLVGNPRNLFLFHISKYNFYAGRKMLIGYVFRDYQLYYIARCDEKFGLLLN